MDLVAENGDSYNHTLIENSLEVINDEMVTVQEKIDFLATSGSSKVLEENYVENRFYFHRLLTKF